MRKKCWEMTQNSKLKLKELISVAFQLRMSKVLKMKQIPRSSSPRTCGVKSPTDIFPTAEPPDNWMQKRLMTKPWLGRRTPERGANPSQWPSQNPQSSLLKEQEFMKKLPYYDLDFCKYGFEYRRRTRLWTNLEGWQPRALCKRDCGNVIENKHIEKAQRLPSNEIPEALVQEMFSAIYKCCVF